MRSKKAQRTVPRRPRCNRCDDTIGVYEVIVVVSDGVARATSLAAEPKLAQWASAMYHLACHDPDLDAELAELQDYDDAYGEPDADWDWADEPPSGLMSGGWA